jgi:hypothetical protein
MTSSLDARVGIVPGKVARERACEGGQQDTHWRWGLKFLVCAACQGFVRWDKAEDPRYGFQRCHKEPESVDAKASSL